MERLACYDLVAGHKSASAPQPETKDATDLFGMADERVRQLAATSLGVEAIDSLTATIVSLRTLADGRWLLDLDNGQQWRQVETARLALKPGDRIRIREAALGSFLLQREAGGRGIRVRRVDPVPAD